MSRYDARGGPSHKGNVERRFLHRLKSSSRRRPCPCSLPSSGMAEGTGGLARMPLDSWHGGAVMLLPSFSPAVVDGEARVDHGDWPTKPAITGEARRQVPSPRRTTRGWGRLLQGNQRPARARFQACSHRRSRPGSNRPLSKFACCLDICACATGRCGAGRATEPRCFPASAIPCSPFSNRGAALCRPRRGQCRCLAHLRAGSVMWWLPRERRTGPPAASRVTWARSSAVRPAIGPAL
jgi:hypothetical protein